MNYDVYFFQLTCSSQLAHTSQLDPEAQKRYVHQSSEEPYSSHHWSRIPSPILHPWSQLDSGCLEYAVLRSLWESPSLTVQGDRVGRCKKRKPSGNHMGLGYIVSRFISQLHSLLSYDVGQVTHIFSPMEMMTIKFLSHGVLVMIIKLQKTHVWRIVCTLKQCRLLSQNSQVIEVVIFSPVHPLCYLFIPQNSFS